jgi:hypothetical protein
VDCRSRVDVGFHVTALPREREVSFWPPLKVIDEATFLPLSRIGADGTGCA